MATKRKRTPSVAVSEAPLQIAVKLGPRAPRGLKELATPLGVLRIAPLIESLAPKEVDALVERARRRDPEFAAPDFSSWVQVRVPAGTSPDELAKLLRSLELVETAYVMRPGPPPAVNAADDPRSANQGYLEAAPNGIDARYAWGFAGGDGAGVAFVDIEQGWNLGHEDLATAGITLLSGLNFAYPEHGTSVLGEIAMVDNALGGIGIAPAATGRVVSQHRTAASYNTADAILTAVAAMAFGDVLLLEAQEFDPVGGNYFWPVEIADASYDAIRLGTALGIVVVEAGCNGSYDLDAYSNLAGKKIFDRASADFRDSGAIMVGAGSSSAPHGRLGFSNFGSRIDCYGWGENIDTASTDSAGTDNTAYTTNFGGTSGASPVIVGAALIVQGLAQAALGYRFSPLELRRLLASNGTASANPSADEIGIMPDLRAIITGNRLNLAPDLYLRDYVGDVGNPTSGMVSQSPDIIVRQAAVAAPAASFGAGSGTENNVALSDNVVAGQSHFVYVRMRNRGGSATANASVDVYWSPPSTLVTPNLWHLIGTAMLPSVPTGNVLTAGGPINWPSASIPATGHYCFVAVAGNADDPKPGLASLGSFAQYLTFVENNNNVAWRNFNVVAGPPPAGAPPGSYRLPFFVAGAFDTGHRFELEALGHLPDGSRAFLDIPRWLAGALRPHPDAVKADGAKRLLRMALHPNGVQRLGSAVLHAKSLAECALVVQIPARRRQHDYEFSVRQLYNEREVGRVTWRFAALKDGAPTTAQRKRGK